MSDELGEWAKDIGNVAGLMTSVIAVTEKAAVNIKKDWQAAWKGHPHFKALPFAIGYDRTLSLTALEYVIGPDKDKRQGALGNIIEFGTVNNAPIPGGLPAQEKELPRLEAQLAAILTKALG